MDKDLQDLIDYVNDRIKATDQQFPELRTATEPPYGFAEIQDFLSRLSNEEFLKMLCFGEFIHEFGVALHVPGEDE